MKRDLPAYKITRDDGCLVKLIKGEIIHNCAATDELNGRWHKGFRMENSENTAFHHKGRWYASNPTKPTVDGPFPSREQALKGELAA